jgi:thiol:disulfide interchange protein DsbC
MRHDQLVAKTGSCRTPLKTIQTLAQQLNIQGTPALIFPSGKVVPGAIPLAAINELLNQSKP